VIFLTSIDAWPIMMMLVMGNIVNVIVMKPGWLTKIGKAIIGLISTSIMASTITYLYSHYSFDSLHVMNHTFFKTGYVLTALILVSGNFKFLFEASKNLHYKVETNIFDQIQYSIPRIITRIAKKFQKIQTGNLNNNMLIVLIFFPLLLIALIIGSLL
jgi:hypothetical protein